ncbi:MAG: nuclear transport factor 2 family protein [Candidatus Binataceae bacterium]|jgi:ketosteroid isomerase-like protein
MKTTDELVRELADREAIRDLPIRYCDCLCRNDLEGLVSLFTEDGTFAAKDPENEVITRGRAELKKMYENLVSEVYPRPYIHTHIVELRSGDRATGRCYVELRSAKVAIEWVGSGYYEDSYAKVGEEWKFASRRLIEIGMAISLRTFMVS